MARRARKSVDDPATAYARAVVEGRKPAGPHVRGACKRHLSDLDRGIWHWDVAAVERALSFFREVLRLNGGEHEGLPFDPLDWQCFIIGSVFGWKGSDNYRRIRVAYIESAKGSGKSPLAAGIGLYMLVADHEPRAEVYAAAGQRDQAQVLFRDAVAMRDQSPLLAARLKPSGAPGKEWNLAHLESGSFFRTIASDTAQSGYRPHCALLDEIHEHRDASVVNMMRAGTKGRRQALQFMITNSGHDRTSVCWNYHEYGAAICAGEKEDDAFFAFICALDEGDDPFKDESCWGKANPSLGQTFGMKYLREQVTQARGMPSQEAIVRRLNFCQWTDAATPWVDRDLWDRCERTPEEFNDAALKTLPSAGGLDLSLKTDLTAYAEAAQHPGGRVSAAVWFWTPGDTLDNRARVDNVPYATWKAQGHLFAPPGRMIDKGFVAAFIRDRYAERDLRTLAYDQAMIDDFHKACADIDFRTWVDLRAPDSDEPPGEGLRLRRHGQGWSGYDSKTTLWMPRSIEKLERLIVQGNIDILFNPVLRWNSASAVLLPDPSNNRRWDKRKSTGRIDGMVALSMALGALEEPASSSGSIWDRDELW